MSSTGMHFKNGPHIRKYSICIIIGLCISSVFSQNYQENVCETPECIAMADQLFSYMDPDVDPCDDFYQYACGGWIKSNRNGNYNIQSTNLLINKINIKLENFLESDWKSQSQNLNAIFDQAKVFYDSCLNDDTSDENDLNEYKTLTMKMLNVTLNNSDLFTDLFTAMLQVTPNPFFNIDVGEDVENRSNGIIVEVTSPSIPKKEISQKSQQNQSGFDTESLSKARLIGIRDIFEEFCLKHDMSIDNFWILYHQFKGNFKQIISEQLKKSEKMSISELQKIFEKVDWTKLLTNLYGIQFHPDDKILVEDPQYMADLNQLFQSYSDKELQVLTTYYATAAAANVMLSKKNRDVCLYYTKKYLPLSLSLLFVESSSATLLASIEKDSNLIFETLNKTLTLTITNCNWMSSETKEKFLKKLSLLDAHFGKLALTANDPVFKNILQVKLQPDNFLRNVISLSAENLLIDRNDYKEFVMDKNKHLYGLKATTLKNSYVPNAINFLLFNQIVVFMARFYPPKYMMNVPKYVSFGNLGNTIAHEIYHGFDIRGFQYDEEGNENHIIIEDSKDEQQFNNRLDCFIEKYPLYFNELIKTKPGYNKYIQLNGTQTLGENLADSAITVTFQAYKSVASADEQLLPGLKKGNLSKDKVFFLSMAQTFCATTGLIDYPNWLASDEHTPNSERVNLMVMNSGNFSAVFNCPSQSRMNVKTKCSIW